MTILNGNYTSASLTEEYGFCLWLEQADQQSTTMQHQEELLDLGACWDESRLNLPRLKLAECLFLVMNLKVDFAEPLNSWLLVTRWVRNQAEQGNFYPGMIQYEDSYFARWLLDSSSPKIKEELQEWGRFVSGNCSQECLDELVLYFIRDTLDSYIRFVINTRISLNSGQLGKFLRYKPFYQHEEWFNQLCVDEPIPGEGKRWHELYLQVTEWSVGRTEESVSSGRLGFRLNAMEHEPWHIEYVWEEPNGLQKKYHELGNPNLRHRFLQLLAEAALDFPLLTMRSDHAPYYCAVTMQEAQQFLKEFAPRLRMKGHPVWAPTSLVRNKKATLGMSIELHSTWEPRTGLLGLGSLLDFQVDLSLAEENVTVDELEGVLERGQPFAKRMGEWVLLDHEELKKAMKWVKKQTEKGKLTLKDALFLQAMQEDPSYLPFSITSLYSNGWVQDWLDQIGEKNSFELLPQPASFEGQLRPYQQVGMSWLIQLRKWGGGACLSDDMGLGKTIQFLAYLSYCKERGWLTGPFLLVCPTSVLGNWQKEIERFVPHLSFYTHHGSDRLSGDLFSEVCLRSDMVLTTYSIIQRDFQLLQKVNWDGMVLDEAQHIKNASTIQARAIRSIPCHHRIALTGTPIENRLEELWSIFEYINRGYLGSVQNFRREFVLPIEKEQNGGRLDSLKKLIRPFFLRRSKNDPDVVNDLPEKIEKKEYCYLTSYQAQLYQQVVDQLLQQEGKILGMKRKGLILAAISRLKQICDHPALIDPNRVSANTSGKLIRLKEMMEEMLAEGDRILVFTQFSRMGEALKQVFQETWKIDVPFMHGGVRKEQRDRMVENFQSADGPPIFLLSLKAGGIGLNLTRANRVIHFDRWWNPAVENQATDRAYRIGQKETVHVHKMICVGTIEEKIDSLMERKQRLVSEIIHTGENWVTELSSHELRDLVAFRSEFID